MKKTTFAWKLVCTCKCCEAVAASAVSSRPAISCTGGSILGMYDEQSAQYTWIPLYEHSAKG